MFVCILATPPLTRIDRALTVGVWIYMEDFNGPTRHIGMNALYNVSAGKRHGCIESYGTKAEQ